MSATVLFRSVQEQKSPPRLSTLLDALRGRHHHVRRVCLAGQVLQEDDCRCEGGPGGLHQERSNHPPEEDPGARKRGGGGRPEPGVSE